MSLRTDAMPWLPPVPSNIYVVDFSGWKRPVVRQCFPQARLFFVRRVTDVPEGETALVWGRCEDNQDVRRAVRLLRVEDGFLRSVGLGVDLIRPMSWVVDGRGTHYDATQVSDLEHVLSTQQFGTPILERAARLRARIAAEGLTKYNVGTGSWRRPVRASRVILVPGQVETDASLAYGAPGLRTNLSVVKAVRQANPKAYVIYKPHPDVLVGLRAKGTKEDEAEQWCDEMVTDVSMASLLDAVDEVHVMTSLAGFEALLRGKKVTCYGQPFYAGWGLTADVVPHLRRSRRLTLDELVAGALIKYPRYFSRDGKRLLPPERALDELLAWRASTGGVTPWWRKAFRVVLRGVVGVR